MKGTQTGINHPSGSQNGFVSDTPSADSSTPQAGGSNGSAQPWYFSPRFLAIGGSTIGGFVIGWAMRAFVKTVTLAIAAVGGLIAALSYFRFFNVDFSAAHQDFATAAAWFNSQIGLLKDAANAHLPSHMGAAVGAFIGFRRR